MVSEASGVTRSLGARHDDRSLSGAHRWGDGGRADKRLYFTPFSLEIPSGAQVTFTAPHKVRVDRRVLQFQAWTEEGQPAGAQNKLTIRPTVDTSLLVV